MTNASHIIPEKCPICGGVPLPAYMAGEHRMYRCRQCRTAFLYPVPDDKALAAFYARYHLATTEGGWYDEIETRMQADFSAKIALLQKQAPADQPVRLLDVGCGKGYFVKACVDAGIETEGIDLSESGVAFATRALGVKATCGQLHNLKNQLGLFDTITLWATIEHLPRPAETLADIFDLLKPGGRVLLDTGIGDDWLDRLLPGLTQWYDPPQHLWVFSADGITRMLRNAGFELVRLDPCFERTALRRFIRMARNGAAALGLRAIAEGTRLRSGEFELTRYPLGNLMSVIARRP